MPASPRHCVWYLLPLFPLVAAAVAMYVIWTCVGLAREHGHIPAWLDFPAISTAGVHAPEVTLYQVGFVLLSSLLFFMEACMSRLLRESLSSLPAPSTAAGAPSWSLGDVSTIQWSGRAGILGLALQGAVPLHDGSGSAGPGTIVHLLSANAFYFASVIHGCYLLVLLENAAGLPNSRRNAPLSFFFKVLALASAVLPSVPATLLAPGGVRTDPSGRTPLEQEMQMESSGFAQWWWVGSILAFFTSYAADFACFLWLAPPPKDVQEDLGDDEAVPGGSGGADVADAAPAAPAASQLRASKRGDTSAAKEEAAAFERKVMAAVRNASAAPAAGGAATSSARPAATRGDASMKEKERDSGTQPPNGGGGDDDDGGEADGAGGSDGQPAAEGRRADENPLRKRTIVVRAGR